MGIIFTFPDYLLFFVSVINLMLSIFIFANNPRHKINTWFAVFALFMSLWPLTLLLYRNVSLPYAHFWMRASYLSAVGIALSFWYFVHFFPTSQRLNFYNSTLLLLATLGLIGLFFDQTFISRAVIQLANGQRTVIVDWFGYVIFTIYFTTFFFGGLLLLWLRYRKTEKALQTQAHLLLLSILVAGLFGVFFNLVLPSPFLENFSYIHLGPFFTFLIVLTVAYGVAKYRLMNIKALAAEVLIMALIFSQFLRVALLYSRSAAVLDIIILVAVLIIGFLLIRSIKKEEMQRREELAQANFRLQGLDQQKDELLTTAAHQFRTPLSAIKGYVSLLADGSYGKMPTDALPVLSDLEKNNERLIRLVDQLLLIISLEQGKESYRFTASDPRQLVTEVVDALKKPAVDKGLRILWSPSQIPVGVLISLDQDKIKQVVIAFVENAIMYSERGTVTISAGLEDNGLVVRVKDEGIGFDQIDAANFFQKLHRGHNVAGVNVDYGAGLNLYIASKFIAAHGGQVWAKSAGLGHGSEFGFWVPATAKV